MAPGRARRHITEETRRENGGGSGDGSSEGGDVPDPSNTGGAFQEGKGSEPKRREIER